MGAEVRAADVVATSKVLVCYCLRRRDFDSLLGSTDEVWTIVRCGLGWSCVRTPPVRIPPVRTPPASRSQPCYYTHYNTCYTYYTASLSGVAV